MMRLRPPVVLGAVRKADLALLRLGQLRLLVEEQVDGQQMPLHLELVVGIGDQAFVAVLDGLAAVVLILDVGFDLGQGHARDLVAVEEGFGLVDRFDSAVRTHDCSRRCRRSRRFRRMASCREAIEGPFVVGSAWCAALTAVTLASSFMGMLTRLISSRSTDFSLRTLC